MVIRGDAEGSRLTLSVEETGVTDRLLDAPGAATWVDSGWCLFRCLRRGDGSEKSLEQSGHRRRSPVLETRHQNGDNGE